MQKLCWDYFAIRTFCSHTRLSSITNVNIVEWLVSVPLVAGVTFSDSDSAFKTFEFGYGSGSGNFFKFENPTPVQTPAIIIDPTVIYPCFYLRNDHTDCCYCRN